MPNNNTSLYGTSQSTTNIAGSNLTSLYPTDNVPVPPLTGDLVVTGNLIVQGGNIITDAATASIFNTTATTVNIGGNATTVSIGADTGTTTINNDLVIGGAFIADSAQFTNLTVTNPIVGQVTSLANHTTTDLPEGTNLYYTTQRARSAISAGTGISYNPATGVITNTGGSGGGAVSSVNGFTGAVSLTTTNIPEGAPNLYYTNARARASLSAGAGISYNSTTGVISATSTGGVVSVNGQTGVVSLNSDNIPQGTTNLYFSNALARAALSGGTGVTYNSSTGVIAIGQDVATSASPNFVNMTLSGDIAVNGGDINTNQTTFNLINTTATTANIAGAATTLTLGAATGTTTIRNPLYANKGVLITTSGGVPVTTGLWVDYLTGANTARLYTGGSTGNFSFRNNLDTTPTTLFDIRSDGQLRMFGSQFKGNAAQLSTPTLDMLLTASRGTSPDTSIKWNESTDHWQYTNDGTNYFNIGNGLVTSVTGSGSGISVSPTTGDVVVTNTGVTSAVAGTHITVSSATGAVTIGTDATSANTASTIVARDSSGNFTAGTVTLANRLTLNGSSSGSVGLIAPAVAGSQTYTLPTAYPAVNNYVLKSTTAGVLSWGVDTGTNYTFTASAATGGANLTLTGSDSTTNTVKVSSGTGITVADVSATEISVTNTGVTSITGTTNQVIASASTGAVTLSLPQSIATSNSPTFNNLTLNGNLNQSSGSQISSNRVATYTSSTTSPNQIIMTFTGNGDGTNNLATVKFIVQIISGTDYQAIEMLGIVNPTGDNTRLTQYADVKTGSVDLATFRLERVSSGTFRLDATPTNAVTTFKIVATAITT
jgi:hypothetical protein